jgi:hypothetical protein
MRISQYRVGIIAFSALITVLGIASYTAAQQKPVGTGEKAGSAAPQSSSQGDEKGAKAPRPWQLKISKELPRTFSLKAKEASLREITNELSELIKVSVFMSPLLEKQLVSFDFSGINLEGTVRMFAPQAFIDYEVGGDDQSQPKPLAIYLQAFNERPPSTTQVVKGSSEAILIEGDTEEGVEDEEARKKREAEDPLRVSYAKNYLTIKARKQPLTVVLFKIASELGIPFEMRYESPEIVDVEFTNYTVESALRSLSPSVRLFYRTDLQSYEVQPLRIVLAAPSPAKS